MPQRLIGALLRGGLALAIAYHGGAQAAPAKPHASQLGVPTVSTQLADYYADQTHYRAVRDDVLRWHHTTRNSCVAFIATALWQIGAPLGPATQYNGELASRLLRPFAGWLAATYVTEAVAARDLRAGDVVFAGPAVAPTHVYVFIGWKHAKRQLARVVDNQGRLYVRPVNGNRGAYSPFGFALRLVALRSPVAFVGARPTATATTRATTAP